MTETLSKRTEERIGCVFTIVLWVVLILHWFSDRIWDKEPAFFKWFFLGFGALVLIRLCFWLVAGKRRDRLSALVTLAFIAIVCAFIAFAKAVWRMI